MGTETGKDRGYVWLPYVMKAAKTDINGETVWYASRWRNFLLRIKNIFIRPKHLRNGNVYRKTVDPSRYGTLVISGKEGLDEVSVSPKVESVKLKAIGKNGK